MKKYSKKIALILVLALTVAAAIPALAAQTTKITGKYEESTIEVKIPTAGETVINPYGLPVKIKADNGAVTSYTVGKDCQIATRPLVGVNLSDFNLKIGATVTAVPKGEFTLLAAKPANGSKEKEGLVYFEIANPTGTDGLKYTGETNENTVCGGFDAETVEDELNKWTATSFSGKGTASQILVSEDGESKQGMCTLVKSAVTTDGAGNTTVTPAINSYFMARIAGEVVKVPETEWKTSDGFTATISWIIEPDNT